MAGNKILIHIGMPKTGSSSLQKFLAYNNDRLKINGWYYPDLNGSFENDDAVISSRYMNGGIHHFAEYINSGNDTILLSHIHQLMDIHSRYNVILSQEGIWTHKYGIPYVRYLAEKFEGISLTVFLRRQDFEIEAIHSQRVKVCQNREAILNKENRMDLNAFSWYAMKQNKELKEALFLYKKLSDFEAVVGEGNIIVILYDENRKNDVIPQFVSLIGLRYEDFRKIMRANITPSAAEIEVKRKFNVAFSDEPSYIFNKLDREFEGNFWKLRGGSV